VVRAGSEDRLLQPRVERRQLNNGSKVASHRSEGLLTHRKPREEGEKRGKFYSSFQINQLNQIMIMCSGGVVPGQQTNAGDFFGRQSSRS
jgi:hypothetical protein